MMVAFINPYRGGYQYLKTKADKKAKKKTRMEKTMILEFDYVNYKGESSHRRARMESVRFGSSPYHQEPQWLMRATDLDKREERDFALKDMTNVREVE